MLWRSRARTSTIALLHTVTGRPGTFMSVIAHACGSFSITAVIMSSHEPAAGGGTPNVDASWSI